MSFFYPSSVLQADKHSLKYVGRQLHSLPLMAAILFVLLIGKPATAAAADLISIYHAAENNDLLYLSAISRYRGDQLVAELGASRYKPNFSYRYRIADKRYKTDQKSLGLDPNFDPSECGGITDYDCLQQALRYDSGNSDYQSQEHALLVTQPIYDNERVADKRKSDVLAEQAEAEFRVAQQDLLMRVSSHYFSVLKAEDDVILARQQLQSTQAQKLQAQKRYHLGVGRENEVFDAEAAYDSQISAYDMARTNKQIQLRLLADISGLLVQVDYRLSETMPVIKPEPMATPHWLQLAQAHSPQLKVAELSERAVYFDYQKKKKARWPTVMVMASYSETKLKEGQGFEPAATSSAIGLEVNVPIYQGGSINAAKKQAAYRVEEAKQRLQNQQKMLNSQVVNKLLMIDADIQRFEAKKRSLASAEKALKATRRAYHDGFSSLLDWLQVQRHYYRTKRDLAASRYDYLLNLFRLKQLAGTLAVTDLQQVNNWLRHIDTLDSADLIQDLENSET